MIETHKNDTSTQIESLKEKCLKEKKDERINLSQFCRLQLAKLLLQCIFLGLEWRAINTQDLFMQLKGEPEYRNEEACCQAGDLRRVGYTYCTRDFAYILLREMCMHSMY